MNAPDRAPIVRLTQFSHGGGCGCKIAPGLLQQILADSSLARSVPAALLVGIETSDDAAVYRINDHQAIVATTDFFTPIVDDPHDFGAIAATNAISDVYAMGGTPLFALAIVGMPINQLPVEAIRAVLQGGEEVCTRAGIPLAGGHSIDVLEPIYGLVVIGLVEPSRMKRNSCARAGDALILGKPLGIGVYSAALKKGALSSDAYRVMLASTTQLNTPGIGLGALPDVHALTDVTGFGLLGHLLEICRGSGVGAAIEFARLPLHPGVLDLAASGHVTGASARNWSAYGDQVALDGVGVAAGRVPADARDGGRALIETQRALLTDPQTSGGLLVACAPDAIGEVLGVFAREGFAHAAVIGNVVAGPPRVTVR